MNEFDNLKPKPLDTILHEPKPIPKELKQVNKDKIEKIKLGFGEFMRILYQLLVNKAITIVDPIETVKILKAWKWCTVLAIIFALVVIVSLITLFTKVL